ncbi:MAG: hypothetical protein H0U23_01575 [Blastocatellia bacterium]|nr:hypothetical protein [Blastocatellia bacterium]
MKEGRDIVIYLVCTGIDAGLERMVEFLAERAELALRLVTFSTFGDAQGKMLLAREIHESVAEPKRAEVPKIRQTLEPETVLSLADQNGVGGVVRPHNETAMDFGVAARPLAKSIMFAPPANRSRCLFVVWVERRKEPGLAKAYIAAEAFEQFYGVKESDLTAAIRTPAGYLMLDAVENTRSM